VPRLRKARPLRPGATVALAAPAFAVDAARVAAGEALLRAAGFSVRRRDDLFEQQGYLAGSDARRGAELMQWIDDPEVDAVICARGGWGCHRIVAGLDATRVRAARKPLLGFSDVTTLLLWQLRRAGLVGFHAPMLEREQPLGEEEVESLVRATRGAPLAPWQGEPRGGGTAEGRLVGGSLMLIAASLGTPWEVDTRGAILLFEEIGEKPYSLDRLLQHLRAAGKLDGVAGIGVGHLVGCTDPKRDRPTAAEVVEEVLRPLGVPLVLGLPFGHGRPNLTWPMGVRARLDGERGALAFLEAGVVQA
jgi:muramoyltetrapeptide carboxypeptidase